MHPLIQQEGIYLCYGKLRYTFHIFPRGHCSFNKAILKITWKNDEPIWTEQWPLTKEKLQATKELIDTQLELKYIEESYSPWNSPIFVIKKKSGK